MNQSLFYPGNKVLKWTHFKFLMIYLTRMLGPVILDKEEENQIDHTKDKTKLISNIRKHPMRPNQTRMYDASFSLFTDQEITFQHK